MYDIMGIIDIDASNQESIRLCLDNLNSINNYMGDINLTDRISLESIRDYVVKALYGAGVLRPISFIDRSVSFNPYIGPEYNMSVSEAINFQSDIIVDMQFDKFSCVCSTEYGICPEEIEYPWGKRQNALYNRVFGKVPYDSILSSFEEIELCKFLTSSFKSLYDEAIRLKEPVDYKDLEKLCLFPVDISFDYFGDMCLSWDDIPVYKLSFLDPHRDSVVGFAWNDFVVYLPYRLASKFIVEDLSEMQCSKSVEGKYVSNVEIYDAIRFFGFEINKSIFPNDLNCVGEKELCG